MLAPAFASRRSLPGGERAALRRAARRVHARVCVVRQLSRLLLSQLSARFQRPRADLLGMQPWQSNEVAGLLFGVRAVLWVTAHESDGLPPCRASCLAPSWVRSRQMR